MLKRVSIGLIVAVFLLCGYVQTVYASTVYTDPTTKVMFSVPDGWKETVLSKERETIKVKFIPQEETGAAIMFGWSDLWSEFTQEEKRGLTRADIDMSILSKELCATIFGVNESEVTAKTYNGYPYYKMVSFEFDVEVLGEQVAGSMEYLVYVDNGYMYMFIFGAPNDIWAQNYPAFETLLNSVEYPQKQGGGTVNGYSATSQWSVGDYLLISLMITVVVYSLPIIIYRKAIRKKPVEPKKAKRITIIYGIFAFLLMTVLVNLINGGGAAGGAIVLWSYINYRILTGGKAAEDPEGEKTENADSPAVLPTDGEGAAPSISAEGAAVAEKVLLAAPEPTELVAEEAAAVELVKEERLEPLCEENPVAEEKTVITAEETMPQALYCRKCGKQLPIDSNFCSSCGTAVIRSV